MSVEIPGIGPRRRWSGGYRKRSIFHHLKRLIRICSTLATSDQHLLAATFETRKIEALTIDVPGDIVKSCGLCSRSE